MMFTKTEKELLLAAVDLKTASVKRYQKGASPRLAEVYNLELADYTALSAKVRGIPDETSSGPKK